jgi:hypothetical protein
MDMATPTPFQAPAPVIESFTADRREIMVGETVTLAWRIRNAASAYLQASGQQVTVALEGNLLLAPPQNTTYQLIASGAGGSASAGMTIIVRPRPPGSTIRADSLPSTLPSLPVESIVSPAATPPLPQLAATLSPLPPQVVAAAPLQPPTVSPVPTLAPVVLAGVATAPTVAGAPSTVSVVVGQESGATTFILLIGALALMGVPLLGLSLLLVFWALRSVRR